ncbi:hypothetical protein MHM88_14445 [Epibacterium sp. MM17-32]|uniref:hypothetical protein n=1 Tax=Epibacterium sp. MM17-32 TaxID=2917734 RepID=UPI001EF6FE04|nr:hypothetical protein [Epibacterium sp. MM17-32]MCG7629008.1 hypothetical protein [Epibacterium sp. MM17-32]
MSYGHYIQPKMEELITGLESTEGAVAKQAAAEIRSQTKRGDDNAARIRHLEAKMEGMLEMAEVFARAR